MPSDPPLPETTVRKGLASGVHTPPGRTTVSLDLKGCLEEVGNHAARAGTWQQRHDHTEATRDSKDDGTPDPSHTRARTGSQEQTTSRKGGETRVSRAGRPHIKIPK